MASCAFHLQRLTTGFAVSVCDEPSSNLLEKTAITASHFPGCMPLRESTEGGALPGPSGSLSLHSGFFYSPRNTRLQNKLSNRILSRTTQCMSTFSVAELAAREDSIYGVSQAEELLQSSSPPPSSSSSLPSSQETVNQDAELMNSSVALNNESHLFDDTYRHVNEDEKLKEARQLYAYELEVATQAVQLACQLSMKVQKRLMSEEEVADTKSDESPVTVADWGVQAVVSWVLSQAFPEEEIDMVAEEDTDALKGYAGMNALQRVVSAVNECLAEANLVGISPPKSPLKTLDVLKGIQKGSSLGGKKGRHWILDPVDGTLGFVRGDQYAVALAMMEEGEVVLGVLGCPNFPMRTEWLRYPHRYHRIAGKLFPAKPGHWYRGCVMKARKGGSGAWMEPLVGVNTGTGEGGTVAAKPKRIQVSLIDDPAAATFCEPVEKANSKHEISASLAQGIGLSREPLRVYSMAKYAAIARGDAEIFMKFARAGYREKIWDHAAGVIIVEEAGGVVTDAGGRPLDFSKGRFLDGLDRGIIASSSRRIHDYLLGAVDASQSSSRL